MLTFNTFKIILTTMTFAIIVSGCSTIQPHTSSGRPEKPPSESPIAPPETISQPQSMKPADAQIDASWQSPSQPPDTNAQETTISEKVKIDDADIEFVQYRLQEYENKFEHWLEISDMAQDTALAHELTALETECVQKLESILTGYSLLLDRMQQSQTVTFDKLAAVDPKEMQQLDIAFLENRCGELLAMDIAEQFEFMPETVPELSFTEAQDAIASHVVQGNHQEALFAYNRLSQDFPDQEPSLSTMMNYGLALQYTGQVEAAARHFKKMLESGNLSVEPLSLQREIADLLLAGGEISAAESFYDAILLTQETIEAEKRWAEEQLAFLRSIDPESEEMIAYIKLLRDFQTYDYRIHAPQLNELANNFAAGHAGSPTAVSALRLKNFAAEQVRLWFGRQLAKIDALVVEKKFTEATNILNSMSQYYLPAELQAVLQKTFYEVAQAEIQENEIQRRIQHIELTEQWDGAVNLLDSQRYDIAISAFEALLGTEYEDQAKIKIKEAANQAASQMRKEAASLFIRAGKTPDFEQKKQILVASHALLNEILIKYPQTDLLDKVQQNIAILEEQIERIDPSLLEELHQDDPAEMTADPSPSSGQPQ